MQQLTAQEKDSRIDRGFSRLLEETAARVAAGEQRLGWKVGINSPNIQKRLGLGGPVLGTLMSATLHSGGVFPTRNDGTLLIEAELALRLGTATAASGVAAGAVPAIAEVAPALEMLCIDGPLDDLAEVIARNSYHAAFAVGPWTPGNGAAQEGVAELDLRIDDGRVFALDPELVVGKPTEIVRFAAAFLASRGGRLAEGDILLCGALNPPAIVRRGQRVDAALAPGGTITAGLV